MTGKSVVEREKIGIRMYFRISYFAYLAYSVISWPSERCGTA